MEKSRASIKMSKSVGTTIGISNLLDSVASLSLILEKETSKEEESLVVAVLNKNLEEIFLIMYSKAITWQILARILVISLLYIFIRRSYIRLVIQYCKVAR